MGPNVLGVYAAVQHNENLKMLSGLSETWTVEKSQYYNFVMTPQISFIFSFIIFNLLMNLVDDKVWHNDHLNSLIPHVFLFLLELLDEEPIFDHKKSDYLTYD